MFHPAFFFKVSKRPMKNITSFRRVVNGFMRRKRRFYLQSRFHGVIFHP